MPRVDDNVQEVVQLVVKASRMSGRILDKAIKWYLSNKEDNKRFKQTVGKTDLKELNATENTVKFLPTEIDKEMMELYSKHFKKYNIHFAVEKQAKGIYKIAFAGRNAETVEYAMARVVEDVAKIQKEKENSGLKKIRDFFEEVKNQDKNRNKERDRIKEKDRSR